MAKTRVSLDLNPTSMERLIRLEKMTRAESHAAVIRQSLLIFEYIMKNQLEGRKLVAINPDGTQETPVFFLP